MVGGISLICIAHFWRHQMVSRLIKVATRNDDYDKTMKAYRRDSICSPRWHVAGMRCSHASSSRCTHSSQIGKDARRLIPGLRVCSGCCVVGKLTLLYDRNGPCCTLIAAELKASNTKGRPYERQNQMNAAGGLLLISTASRSRKLRLIGVTFRRPVIVMSAGQLPARVASAFDRAACCLYPSDRQNSYRRMYAATPCKGTSCTP